jgi:hypothetical protein
VGKILQTLKIIYMTKQQFIDGAPFNNLKISTRPFRFTPVVPQVSIGSVSFISFFGAHHADVARVTDNYFDVHHSILGKRLTARFYFKDLYS